MIEKLAVIQPHLTNASQEMFLELSQHCALDLVVSPAPAGSGFAVAPLPGSPRIRLFSGPTFMPLGKNFGWIQWSAVKYMLRQRPGAVLVNANPRYLTFWMTLLWAKVRGIPAYAHGHGFYRRGRIGGAYRMMMRVMLELLTSYVCYAPIVREAFLENGFSGAKLTVAHNSLINRFPVRPREKTGEERGILFIGRLRAGNRLELLMRVLERIRREDGLPLELHVIGDGEQREGLEARARDWPWVRFHGASYDGGEIRRISLACFAGCYPGIAGLSVIHMMSLSLPVVTHNDLRGHGPEPSFIRDGVNGLLFDHNRPEASLYGAVRRLALDRDRVAGMRENAFQDYHALANPSLAARFWAIMGGPERPGRAGTAGAAAPPSPEMVSEARAGAGSPLAKV